ncbi:MotA/TolQ/ExbB proton channel family protein [Sulfuritalea sp.]|uniref:MotA/TolQ/ExbB proton channel family protein n=1 Tax=Sulfuritalea sp. TaxID=2480090 RepID=UPI00286E0CDD|nr:MotA/TolQ/ExbB proton channel family protein [Sulfuritalea sp.]
MNESSIIELVMYQIGQLFLLPVLLLVAAMFAYALYALGGFVVQMLQRRRRTPGQFGGLPLLAYVQARPAATLDELDLHAHKLLEPARLASRIAPMLGLVGTMIPMGPALKSLSDGNLAQVSGNLTVAFSVVILALIAASITYWISNVRRRWLAEELLEIQNVRQVSGTAA